MRIGHGRRAVKTRTALIAALSFPALLSCSSPTEPVVCTAIAIASLSVTVREAATGTLVCDATVTATTDGRVHALERFTSETGCGYAGPYEVPGLFEIRATRGGYAPKTVGGVRVTADECHVIPVRVTVDLDPSA